MSKYLKKYKLQKYLNSYPQCPEGAESFDA